MKPKAIKNILYTVFMTALTIFVIILLMGRIQNRVTFIFDRAVIWIISPSMEEEIPKHSYILIKKADPSKIQVDDVIVFYSDDPSIAGELNTHRVIEVIGDNKEFVTKGDNMIAADSYTAKANKVVGVYKGKLKFLSIMMQFFRSGFGLALIIVTLIGVLGLSFIQKKKPRLKKIESTSQTDSTKINQEEK